MQKPASIAGFLLYDAFRTKYYRHGYQGYITPLVFRRLTPVSSLFDIHQQVLFSGGH